MRLLGTRSGHQHGELVSADPERPIGPAKPAPQQLADPGEGFVAHGMTARLVEQLEVVKVDEHECHGVAVAPHSIQLTIELLLEGAVIPEASERVDEGVRAVAVLQIAELTAGQIELFGQQQHAAGTVADQPDAHDEDGRNDHRPRNGEQPERRPEEPARADRRDDRDRAARGRRDHGGGRDDERQANTDQLERFPCPAASAPSLAALGSWRVCCDMLGTGMAEAPALRHATVVRGRGSKVRLCQRLTG